MRASNYSCCWTNACSELRCPIHSALRSMKFGVARVAAPPLPHVATFAQVASSWKRSCEEASAQVDEVARITKRSQVDDAKLADSCNGDGRPLRSMLLEVAKLHQTSRWTSGTRITLVYFTPNTHVTASADARSFLQTKCNFNLPRRSNDDAPLSELIQQWVRVSSIPGRLFQ